MTQQQQLKSDWYQTDQYVIITVMIKGIKTENVLVDVHKTDLSLSIKLDETRETQMNWNLLEDVKLSKVEVLSTKIEIKLEKVVGKRWESLEPKEGVVQPIAYPSSSKKVLKVEPET
jgi:suppressor of G2 allele of SKP1